MISSAHTDTPLGSRERRWLLALSLLPLVLNAAGALTPHYSYFIDEFYYLACAKRPAFGYVDHPPLAPWLLMLTSPIHRDSLLGIRILAGLGQAATVWMSGLLAWRFGGGRVAIAMAASAVALCPIAIGMSSFYSMNAFEPLLWTLVVYALVRRVQTGDSRLWLVVGALIGLSFLNKHTVLAFVIALAVGVVATRARRTLRDPWLWAGCAVAVALAAPNIWWEVATGWPSLEFYRLAQTEKNVYSPPLRSIVAMVVIMNVATAPLWVAGLVRLMRQAGREWRFLGVMAAVAILEYVVSGSSRPDRPFAVFPLLFAAGGVWFEAQSVRRSAWRWLPVPLVAISAIMLPVAEPLLPPPVLARYVDALGLKFQFERGKHSPLPQVLADRTGWPSFIDDVDRVYRSLPPEDRKRAIIYVPDYGHAGALELWGPARGLPRVISGHNTYWMWSAGHTNTEVLIAVSPDPRDLKRLFRDVRQDGWVDCEYCMSWRSHMPIYVARGSIVPVETVWAKSKGFE
jgi:hypothetical protein